MDTARRAIWVRHDHNTLKSEHVPFLFQGLRDTMDQ